MWLSIHGMVSENSLFLSDNHLERITHIDHVYRLAWRPTDDTPSKELATCSEDGTLKILIVHVGIN